MLQDLEIYIFFVKLCKQKHDDLIEEMTWIEQLQSDPHMQADDIVTQILFRFLGAVTVLTTSVTAASVLDDLTRHGVSVSKSNLMATQMSWRPKTSVGPPGLI